MGKLNAGRLFSLPVVEPPEVDVYDDGYLRVEHEDFYLACGGKPLYLPRVEFLLMSRLSRSINRVVRSEELWRAAWENRKPLNSASLHVYIHRLRTKLAPYRLQIDTVIYVGYRLLKSQTVQSANDGASVDEPQERATTKKQNQKTK